MINTKWYGSYNDRKHNVTIEHFIYAKDRTDFYKKFIFVAGKYIKLDNLYITMLSYNMNVIEKNTIINIYLPREVFIDNINNYVENTRPGSCLYSIKPKKHYYRIDDIYVHENVVDFIHLPLHMHNYVHDSIEALEVYLYVNITLLLY